MSASTTIKLAAVLVVCLSGLEALSLTGVCVLLALLDASEKQAARLQNTHGVLWLAAMLQEFAGLRVLPFYATLAGLMIYGRLSPEPPAGTAATGLASARGWKLSADPSAGTNHRPADGGLCACGKPLGHDKTAVAPPTAAETATRLEKLKQRSMTPPPNASQLPGLSPNARPLPPGLKPNPNAKLPAGVQPSTPPPAPPKA